MFSRNRNIITIEDFDIKIQAFELVMLKIPSFCLQFKALDCTLGSWNLSNDKTKELTLFLLLSNHKYLPYAVAKLQYFLVHLSFQEDQMLLKIYYKYINEESIISHEHQHSFLISSRVKLLDQILIPFSSCIQNC